MRSPIALLALAAALLLPGSAFAAKTNAPPGNSGITQYLEVVPSSGGGKPLKGLRPKKGTLSGKARKRLAGAGADGSKLAGFVSASSPTTPAASTTSGSGAAKAKAKANKSDKAAKTQDEPTKTTSDQDNSRAVALAYKDGGGGGGATGGIGVPLIALMAAAAVAVGATRLLRGRGSSADPEPGL